MRRRGMSTIEMVGTFVLVVALILIVTAIYLAIADKFGRDATGLSSCEARAAQAGGRGECSIDSSCTTLKQPPKAGEYAQYLGVQCEDKEGEPFTPPQYCCMVLSDNKNPPATGATNSVTCPMDENTHANCKGKTLPHTYTTESTTFGDRVWECVYYPGPPAFCNAQIVP